MMSGNRELEQSQQRVLDEISPSAVGRDAGGILSAIFGASTDS